MAVNILLKRSSTASKRPVAASMQYGELNLNYDAATGGLYYKNSAGGVVKVGPCQISSAAPNSTPAGSAGNSLGEFWYDSANGILKIWDGTTWIEAAGGVAIESITGTAPIYVDNTDPINPVISVTYATTVGNEGVVQLSNGINDSSTNGWAATPFAVKLANDNANTKLSLTDGGTMLNNIIMGIGTTIFFDNNSSQLTGVTSSVSTTSASLAASATAVKTAYDLAAAALPAAGGTLSGAITFAAGQTFPISGIQVATTSDLGVVQVGTNIDVAAGVISVASASTSGAGVVQLYDGTDSTSTSLALTANQGKNLQDQIDALSVTSNLTLAGTYNASTGEVDSVTTAGAAAGFVVGDDVPAAASGNADYFVIVDVQGSTGPAGTAPYHIGDWFLSDGTAWQFLNVGYQAPAASTTVAGIVELATNAETQTGSDSTTAVTPASLQSKLSDSTSTTSSTTIASSTAVKSAKDAADTAQSAANTAQGVADGALQRTGGTMSGDITFSDAAEGVIFSDASKITAISNSTSTSSSETAASSTAVKSAYDLANAALPKSGGTMTGSIVFDAGQTFSVAGIQDATTSQKGVVQVGTNISVAAGVISVASASTSAAGVVQLTDSTSSTSTSTAATPNAVKSAYDLAAAAVPESVATAKGDILVGTGSGVVGVRSAGTNGQFLIADSSDASGLAYTSDIDGGTY